MSTWQLLVIDQSPDTAEAINRTLRNEGVAVQVEAAATPHDVDQALTRDWGDLVIFCHPDPDDISLDTLMEAVQSENRYLPVIVIHDLDDSAFVAAALEAGASTVIAADADEQLLRTVGRELANIEARRELGQTRRELGEIEQRYALLLESARDAIAYVHQGLHLYANRAYLDLFGYEDFESVESVSLLELGELEDGKNFKTLLRDISKDDYPDGTVKAVIRKDDGDTLDALMDFSPSQFHGEHCTQVIVRPAAEPQSEGLAVEMEKLRRQDTLTHLANRTYFGRKLQETLEPERDSEEDALGVLFLEPDGFGKLYSELGVAKADMVLKDLAQVLEDALEPEDLAARFSDHGFSIMMERLNREGIDLCAEAVLEAFRDHIVDLGERSLNLTASIGVAYLGEISASAEELIQQARKAWREAVQAGGDQISRYRPQFTTVEGDAEERQWVERIRFAVNNENFEVIHQAVVDLEKETEPLHEVFYQLVEEEASVDPERYRISAERNNLGASIDRLLLPRVMASLADPDAGAGISAYLIPISGNSIQDFSFPAWLRRQLETLELDGRRLILQMPADTLETRIKPAKRLIEELAETHCRFSLEHFSNQRSIIKLLDHLPTQFVKLDPGLTQGLVSSSSKQDGIKQAAEAAQRNGVEVLAGQVEDAASLATLWQCGVKLVQGDFLKEKAALNT